MDGASTIAGLIGLAALASLGTVMLIKFFKDARGLSQKLQQWLTQLQRLLSDFQGTLASIQGLQLGIDFCRVEECLRDCCTIV